MSTRTRFPTLYRIVTDLEAFSSLLHPEHALRRYQLAPARAILDSIAHSRGDQFAIVFSRQAGKDEMLAQLLALLLLQHSRHGGTAIVAAPTLQPQATISRDRLRDRLRANPLTKPMLRVAGNSVRLGQGRATFVSAAPGANARGQTADLLLVANEAQDIDPATWDAMFDPMAASTNATTVFMGTVWSGTTLLARQMRHLRELETVDGRQRVWLVPWTIVARDIPAYGDRVRARVAQLGASHPFIRTEYELEELDGDGGLFPAHRIAQMRGDHSRLDRARPGHRYALLIDVGGEEESGGGQLSFFAPTRRDSTALTVVEVDLEGHRDGLPLYRVVDRRIWTGARHTTLHDTLVDLARNVWRASWVVVDATGVGAGLSSFLKNTLETNRGPFPAVRVEPFIFTATSKSRLGWDFLGLIDSGRFKEYDVRHFERSREISSPQRTIACHTEPGTAVELVSARSQDPVTADYYAQLRATTYEVLNGPGNVLRWSVPARDGHDDLVISAALTAVLDGLDLRPRIARGTA